MPYWAAISEVSDAYEHNEEMIEDFHFALIKRDHGLTILKKKSERKIFIVIHVKNQITGKFSCDFILI